MNSFAKLLLVAAVSAHDYTADNGVTFKVNYDSSSSKFKFEINNVEETGSFSLAFGSTPASTDTDIVVFSAIGNGILSDKFGTWSSSSTSGDTASWTNTGMTKDGTKYNWVTYRAADTGDDKDGKINCGTTQTFAWQSKPNDKTGNWSLKTDENCNVQTPPSDSNGASSMIASTIFAASMVAATLM